LTSIFVSFYRLFEWILKIVAVRCRLEFDGRTTRR